MTPDQSSLTITRTASPVRPELARAAESRRGDSPVVHILAASVICVAFASIVWYAVDALFAL